MKLLFFLVSVAFDFSIQLLDLAMFRKKSNIAVKVVDNNGLETIEIFKLKINGVIKKKS